MKIAGLTLGAQKSPLLLCLCLQGSIPRSFSFVSLSGNVYFILSGILDCSRSGLLASIAHDSRPITYGLLFIHNTKGHH